MYAPFYLRSGRFCDIIILIRYVIPRGLKQDWRTHMDRRYYYRLLGVREGASTAEIKKAYDRHMYRLALPDYADDPEYVARKKDQIRHAYSVLLGAAAPATKAQKEAHFEKWKDAEDAGEDGIKKLKRKFERHEKNCEPKTEALTGLEDLKTMLGGVFEKVRGGDAFETRKRKESGNGNTKLAKIVVTGVICLSLFSSLITACGSLIMNLADEISFDMATPEYGIEEVDPADGALNPEAAAWMDHITENSHLYEFYENLDMNTQGEFINQVEWEPGEETQGEIWSEMTDLAYYLGLYSNSDVVWYITGDENFYWESDDYGNATVIAMMMNPPDYTDIAGATNLYSDEVILNYADYLRFLGDVAEDQTEDIMGEAPQLY